MSEVWNPLTFSAFCRSWAGMFLSELGCDICISVLGLAIPLLSAEVAFGLKNPVRHCWPFEYVAGVPFPVDPDFALFNGLPSILSPTDRFISDERGQYDVLSDRVGSLAATV